MEIRRHDIMDHQVGVEIRRHESGTPSRSGEGSPGPVLAALQVLPG